MSGIIFTVFLPVFLLITVVFLSLVILSRKTASKSRDGRTRYRKKTSKSHDGRTRLKNKIESLVPVKISFGLPRSISVVYDDLKQIEGKVVLIREKIKKTENNATVLDTISDNTNTDDLMKKQKEYRKYLCKYYDNYCSLYLEFRFQFYIVLIKDILIEKKVIHTIEVKQFIEAVNRDMEFTKHAVTGDDDINSLFAIIDNAETVQHFLDRINDHIKDELDYMEEGYFESADIEDFKKEFTDFKKRLSKEEKEKDLKNQVLFKNFNKSMAAVNKKIPVLAAYLVSVQSHKIIEDTSPVDEENELNIYKQVNSLGMILENSRKLDEEYDRFIAEKELSENWNNN
ncbi:MAG: hypothetical protein LBD47_12460 [Treponema sp.]|jgi:hypothetical protein|nr:hypothetical protein [Treponema sp.]